MSQTCCSTKFAQLSLYIIHSACEQTLCTYQISKALYSIPHRFLLGGLKGFLKKRKCLSKFKDLYLQHQLFQWSTQDLWKLILRHLVVLELGEEMEAVSCLYPGKGACMCVCMWYRYSYVCGSCGTGNDFVLYWTLFNL